MSARRFAVLAAASIAFAAPPVAAQDPPPPMLPPDAPPEPRPDVPPPPPAPEQTPPPGPVEPLPPPAAPPPLAPVPLSPPASGSAAARTLRGHTFIAPFTVDSAFVTSRVGVAAELGRQWEPGVLYADPKGSYDRSLGLANQHLDAGIAVSDRIELGFDASYSAFLDGDINSAIAFGSRNAWEVRPGLRVRLWSNDSTQIGLRVYGSFGSGVRENPLGVLEKVAEQATDIAGDMNRVKCLAAGDISCLISGPFNAEAAARVTRTVASGGLALAVAHAFNDRFGVQGSVGIEAGYAWAGAGTIGDVGSVPVTFSVGVAPSLDFGPKVPLAVMAEYRLRFTAEPTVSAPMTIDVGTTQILQHTITGGLYYTGRRELSLGAIVSGALSDNSVSYSTGSAGLAPTRVLTGQVSARYYF